MIEPLDPRILSALARDHDDDDNKYVPMAKRCLNEHRNLSGGVSHLLETYKAFQAQLWQHDIPCGHERGADSWHIEFRVCTQYQSTASSPNHRLQRILPSATSASIPRPLKVSSMFMCATSLSSQSAYSTILKIGKQCSNGCGSTVTDAKSLDLYPNSILKSSASFTMTAMAPVTAARRMGIRIQG